MCSRASCGAAEKQRHHVLQLIAEAERAARLVIAGARPDAARQRLIEQPAVHQHVERIVRRAHLDRRRACRSTCRARRDRVRRSVAANVFGTSDQRVLIATSLRRAGTRAAGVSPGCSATRICRPRTDPCRRRIRRSGSSSPSADGLRHRSIAAEERAAVAGRRDGALAARRRSTRGRRTWCCMDSTPGRPDAGRRSR